MAAASYQHQHQYHDHRPLTILNRDDNNYTRFKSQNIAKRKSAVELLQETKPLYVKSEIVLDRKQELRRSLRDYQQLPIKEDELLINGSGAANNVASLSRLNNSTSPTPNIYTNQSNNCSTNASLLGGTNVPFPLPKSPRLIPPPPAFRKSTCSLQLQNKLRKLLNADSKENLLETNSVEENRDHKSSLKNKNDGNSSESEFTTTSATTSMAMAMVMANKCHRGNSAINNLNYHKSLPDLTNVRESSCKCVYSDHGSCSCSPCSACSAGLCKKSTHAAAASWASCKNDCLHTSIKCDARRDTNSGNEEPDNANLRGNSLPTSPVKSCTSYITPPPLYCDTSELLKNRPVSRSKSDVGARNVSSLQSIDIPLYDSTTLNFFFDNLGLKSEEYISITAPRSNTSSPVYFDSSNSSVDSVGGRGSGSENPSINPIGDSPSIVERNARIIKWLCNCRKAFEQVPRFVTPQSR